MLRGLEAPETCNSITSETHKLIFIPGFELFWVFLLFVVVFFGMPVTSDGPCCLYCPFLNF